MLVRDALETDKAAILALNAESVHFLSPMDAARYETLRAMSPYTRVVDDAGTIRAFLLAFREGSGYDSPNYAWFSARYEKFLYVDRVAVAGSAQGRGIGRVMYENLFAFAREHGVDTITAEFYTTPPNENSRKFHASFGFHQVGEQDVFETKHVSLQVAILVP
jgi:predicted GNAT superfamily acetyltransferase